jgi:DNA polymerase-3 subunit gamma/tau
LVYGDQEINEEIARNLLGLPTYEFTYTFAKALGEYNLAEGYSLLQQIFQMGKNPQQFARDLLQHFRNLLLLKADPRVGNLLSLTQEEYDELIEETKLYTIKRLQEIIDQLLILENRLRDLTNAPLVMEMLLIPLFIKPEGGEVILETPSEKEEKKEEVKKQEPVKEEKKSEEKGINIEVIKDKWTTVLERVKKKKVSLEAMLREARIV